MKALSISVDWNLKYYNAPELVIKVDATPPASELRFHEFSHPEVNTANHYVAVHPSGYALFYAWTPPYNNEGFGGASIPITLDTPTDPPTIKTLLGPWSSRTGLVNKITQHPFYSDLKFPLLVGASIYVTVPAMQCLTSTTAATSKTYSQAHDRSVYGFITLPWITEAISTLLPDIELYPEHNYILDEVYHMPRIKGKCEDYLQSKEYMRSLQLSNTQSI